MSEINITIPGGTSKRLLTKGKQCDKNIVVTAEGGDDRYDEGISDGKQQAYDAFWDVFQQNGERSEYLNAFHRWDNEIFNPKYTIEGRLVGLMSYSTIKSTKVPIVAKGSIQEAFYLCSNLEIIESLDITDATNTTHTFWASSKIVDITFVGEIRIGISLPHASSLSNASVQSIIDHLADLTGQTAQTLTFHATVGGKLTEEQKAAISAKNWTLVY